MPEYRPSGEIDDLQQRVEAQPVQPGWNLVRRVHHGAREQQRGGDESRDLSDIPQKDADRSKGPADAK